MLKVLVTGASGFIAPHVIESCLKNNYEVFGIDLKDPEIKVANCKYIKKDIRNLEVKDLENIDFVIHLAFVTNIPYSIENPVETSYDNIQMTVDLLDKVTKAKCKKFIFSSTASLYGNNPIPWKEDMQADPPEPYCWQKYACEMLCKMWSERYHLPTCTLRLFQVFGENQRKDTALSKFIKSKKENIAITLTETTAQSSFRTARRDFIYVKDVADAFVAAAKSSKTIKGDVLNIGSGVMTTMEDIAKSIGGEITFIPKRNFEVEAHQADLNKTFDFLDWKPKVKVLQWLNKFVNGN
jgi:UDP-glucose 4-epimerase